MGFGGLTFTNLAVLAGGLALFVPYIVHLLTRRTPRMLVFPTIQFIKKAEASQSRLFRLRDILLLLVRTAFMLLLLLAFLKPVYRANARTLENKNAAAAIVILDCSLSMGYAGTGFSPFSRAQLAAESVVDKLGANDLANVVLATSTPLSAFEEPSANPFYLKRDIQNAKPTLERADVDAAIAEAVRQLGPLDGLNRAIYFVSDFQRTNWASANFGIIPFDIETVFLSVAEESTVNHAITEVMVQPPVPVVGEEVEITCKVLNSGNNVESAPLDLELKDITSATSEQPLLRNVDLAPGGSATASYRIRVRAVGTYEGTVSLPEDSLSADDIRRFTFRVADQVRVALLSDSNPEDRNGSARFLLHAMNPFASEDGTSSAPGRGTLAVQLLSPGSLDSLSLNGMQIVVLDALGLVTESGARALAQYVRDGGALVMFMSSARDAVGINTLAAADPEIAFPFTIGATIEFPASATPSTITEANFDEPMLRRFRDEPDFGQAHFYRMLQTSRVSGQGQVLARFSDGNIAIARTTVGSGSILFCNFSVDRESSDLSRRTVFLPLLHEMLKAMRPLSGPARETVVGSSAAATAVIPESSEDVRFVTPSDEAMTASIERREDEAVVIFPATDEVGFYRIYADGAQAGTAAVNVDPRESDLTTITTDQLEELARRPGGTVLTAATADPTTIQHMMKGRPLWHYFLIAALTVLGLEQALLLYLRR